jgi:tetraacyldisaccharide 4'-kinase
LVSGQQGGLRAAILRAGLRLAEVPYVVAVRARNALYDVHLARTHHLPIPVVSVGNLTLGGTGKTPMVAWLARWFQQRGLKPAIVSRGYGAPRGRENDEALELRQRLPDVPHFQSPDRVGAARSAIQTTGCQVVVLDDAFQHRRIGRDLDVVMLDALEPFGFGHVFPRGTLREPVVGLRRAQVVVLSRAHMLPHAERELVRQVVRRYSPRAAWAETAHAPRALRASGGLEAPLASVAGQPIAGFCGLGNPAGFRHTLAACGCRVVAFREFPDHHRYAKADIDALSDWAGKLDIAAVVCTQKDLVKLGVDRLGRVPLWALTVELDFLAGQAELEGSLDALVARRAVP